MSDQAAVGVSPRSVAYRTLTFGYGLVAYATGVGSLLVAILMLLGVFHFTGGPIGALPFASALLLNASLLVVFALQHSVMARASFKARWTRIIPEAAERSTFVLATGLVLLPLLALWQPMPERIWSVENQTLAWGIRAVALCGWAYLFAASFAINHFELFGLQQVYREWRGQALPQTPFRERWMYRFDRHPIMTGLLIGMWATPVMTLDHLMLALGFTVYIWLGVFFEERSLLRQWGGTYEAYRQRVPSIVPTLSTPRMKRLVASGREATLKSEV